jgi:hypothetical protein
MDSQGLEGSNRWKQQNLFKVEAKWTLPFTQSMSCNSLLTGGRVFCFMFGFVLFAKNEQLGYETEIFSVYI